MLYLYIYISRRWIISQLRIEKNFLWKHHSMIHITISYGLSWSIVIRMNHFTKSQVYQNGEYPFLSYLLWYIYIYGTLAICYDHRNIIRPKDSKIVYHLLINWMSYKIIVSQSCIKIKFMVQRTNILQYIPCCVYPYDKSSNIRYLSIFLFVYW